jgi:hypothetical protein
LATDLKRPFGVSSPYPRVVKVTQLKYIIRGIHSKKEKTNDLGVGVDGAVAVLDIIFSFISANLSIESTIP